MSVLQQPHLRQVRWMHLLPGNGDALEAAIAIETATLDDDESMMMMNRDESTMN
jgi:hypothetical protein